MIGFAGPARDQADARPGSARRASRPRSSCSITACSIASCTDATSSRPSSQLLRHMSGKPAGVGVGDRPERRTARRSTTCSRARPAAPSSASSARRRCWRALGDPHLAVPRRCTSPARTGRAASCATLGRAARARRGFASRSYTSPHLVDFRERFLVDGRADRRATYVVDFIERWTPAVERLGATFFEATTAMAFDWFARARVDVAVIETGLGGRLDSTNVVRPLVGRRHVDRHRPRGVPRRDARGDRAREGGHLQAGRSRGDRRAAIRRLRALLAAHARERGASPIVESCATRRVIGDVAVDGDGHDIRRSRRCGERATIRTPLPARIRRRTSRSRC